MTCKHTLNRDRRDAAELARDVAANTESTPSIFDPVVAAADRARARVSDIETTRQKRSARALGSAAETIFNESRATAGSLSNSVFRDAITDAKKAVNSPVTDSVNSASQITSQDAAFLSQRLMDMKQLVNRSESPLGVGSAQAAAIGNQLKNFAAATAASVNTLPIPDADTVTSLPGATAPLADYGVDLAATASNPSSILNDVFAPGDTANTLAGLASLSALGDIAIGGALTAADSDAALNQINSVQNSLKLMQYRKLDNANGITDTLELELNKLESDFLSGRFKSGEDRLGPGSLAAQLAGIEGCILLERGIDSTLSSVFSGGEGADSTSEKIKQLLGSTVESLGVNTGAIGNFFESITGIAARSADSLENIQDIVDRVRQQDNSLMARGKTLIDAMRDDINQLRDGTILNAESDINAIMNETLDRLAATSGLFDSGLLSSLECVGSKVDDALKNLDAICETCDRYSDCPIASAGRLRGSLQANRFGGFKSNRTDVTTQTRVNTTQWGDLI